MYVYNFNLKLAICFVPPSNLNSGTGKNEEMNRRGGMEY